MQSNVMRFVCPVCKSPKVAEWNRVLVSIPVKEFDASGNPLTWDHNGMKLSPESGLEPREDGERYHCRDCDSEFETPALHERVADRVEALLPDLALVRS